jgi:hypothetical protein
MKKITIWYGCIPGIFGYGVSAIGETESEVRRELIRGFTQMRINYGSSTPFNKAFEDWGGIIKQVESGKSYYEGLGE